MPTPNFEDAPDGSSSVNHTGSAFSEESQCFWNDIDPWADIPSHPPQLRDPAPVVNSSPNLNTGIGASHVASNPNRRIEARIYTQGPPAPALRSPWIDIVDPGYVPPHPSYVDGSAPLMPPPQTATQVNEAQRRAQINPEWATAQVACPPPTRTQRIGSPPRRTRRGSSDPDAAIRKDPNAWSLREAVELCKLLEVVVPEAGFHIALTGGLLYKEGKRKDCDLMFYQIRGTEPNYEILWKYLTVAGVIRSLSYPENGWLVKATYRGKAVDCLFPNAKKAKKITMGDLATKQDAYQTSSPTPPLDVAGFERSLAELDAERITAAARYVAALTTPSRNSTALCGPETTRAILEAAREIERESERRTGIVDPTSEARARMTAPVLVRAPYTREELLATPAPAPIPPPPTVNAAVAAARIVESAASPFISPPPDFVPSSEERARDLGISVRAYEMRFE